MPNTNLVSASGCPGSTQWYTARLTPLSAWQGWNSFPSVSNSTGVASVNYSSTQAYFPASSAAQCCQACANSTDSSLVESATSQDLSSWDYTGCNVWTVGPTDLLCDAATQQLLGSLSRQVGVQWCGDAQGCCAEQGTLYDAMPAESACLHGLQGAQPCLEHSLALVQGWPAALQRRCCCGATSQSQCISLLCAGGCNETAELAPYGSCYMKFDIAQTLPSHSPYAPLESGYVRSGRLTTDALPACADTPSASQTQADVQKWDLPGQDLVAGSAAAFTFGGPTAGT